MMFNLPELPWRMFYGAYGIWFLHTSHMFDAHGIDRYYGCVFDTVAGTTQPEAWVEGPPWASIEQLVVRAAALVADYE